MIDNFNALKNIYNHKQYRLSNIESSESYSYTFEILYNNVCITDIVHREYDTTIAYHKQFSVLKQFRHNGHARKIHKLECDGYINNGIKKILLNASRDGICVWGKLGFKIKDSQYNNILLDLFRDYLIDVLYPTDEKMVDKIMEKCNSIKKLFSKEFTSYLLPENKQCFSEYLYSEERLIGTITMEKEL